MPSCSCQHKIKTFEERLLLLEGLLVKGNLCLDGDLVISGKIIDPQGNPLIRNFGEQESGPRGSTPCNFSTTYTGSIKTASELLECIASVIKIFGSINNTSDTSVTFTLPSILGNPPVSGTVNITSAPNSGNLIISGSVLGTNQDLTDEQCNLLQKEIPSLLTKFCP